MYTSTLIDSNLSHAYLFDVHGNYIAEILQSQLYLFVPIVSCNIFALLSCTLALCSMFSAHPVKPLRQLHGENFSYPTLYIYMYIVSCYTSALRITTPSIKKFYLDEELHLKLLSIFFFKNNNHFPLRRWLAQICCIFWWHFVFNALPFTLRLVFNTPGPLVSPILLQRGTKTTRTPLWWRLFVFHIQMPKLAMHFVERTFAIVRVCICSLYTCN